MFLCFSTAAFPNNVEKLRCAFEIALVFLNIYQALVMLLNVFTTKVKEKGGKCCKLNLLCLMPSQGWFMIQQ